MTAAVALAYQMWQSSSFWKKWGMTKNPYDGLIPLRLWGQGGAVVRKSPPPGFGERNKAQRGWAAQPNLPWCCRRRQRCFWLCPLLNLIQGKSFKSAFPENQRISKCSKMPACEVLWFKRDSLFNLAFWSVLPWLTYAAGWYLAEAELCRGLG